MKLIAAILLVFLFAAQAPAAVTCRDFESAARNGAPAKRLKSFLDLQWKYLMTTYPEWATYVGYPGQNGRWSDRSLEGIAEQKRNTVCQKKILESIPREKLQPSDRLNFDLALRSFAVGIEGQRFPSEYLAISQMGGVHTEVPDMLTMMPKASEKDYADILSRLEKAPRLISEIETLLREGLKKKVTGVKLFLNRVPAQFEGVLTKKIEDSPLYEPFKEIQLEIPEEKKAELRKKARDLIETSVYPAYKKLQAFVVGEYIPQSRTNIAFTEMPDGKAWYNYMIKSHTTTDMTFDQLHELGNREVERIKSEMTKVKEEAKFKGDLKAFNKFLLEDSKFYFSKPEDLIAAYRDAAKRIDAELPKIFRTLPRLTYGVREIPAFKAASSPAAYYNGGSLESGRAGYFEANTHDLKSRPKWGIEALTMHEAVPGHHFQIALAQELEGLPEFRKHDSQTAFVEGWALYAEGLGYELGLYKDAYSKYGQLSYEIWRAVRLVVDTGMHAKGWTREQAVQYFMEAMPTTRNEAEVEIDRYISWPGQALAYKVGQLKIREFRERAQKDLGDKFNVRLFHDEILRNGSLPMDVLDKQMTEWLSKQKALSQKSG